MLDTRQKEEREQSSWCEETRSLFCYEHDDSIFAYLQALPCYV